MLTSNWSIISLAPTDTVYRIVAMAMSFVHREPPKAMLMTPAATQM